MLATLGRSAAAVLSSALGTRVTLREPQLLRDESRSVVARFHLRGAPGVASAVVKLLRDDGARGFSDWASLQLLGELPDAEGLAPRLLAGDGERRLFVMEDLGGDHNLQAVLEGASAEAAERALSALAAQMARLCAATVGHEGRFEMLRLALPASQGLGRREEAMAWRLGASAVTEWMDAAGVTAPEGLAACLDAVAAAYADPGPWLCFSHGDPAPTNNHIAADGQVRLLDFEYGAFRHALYDITAWTILCPLPLPLADAMGRRFRAALALALSVARDDEAYQLAWAMLCAYRAVALLSWIGPSALEDDGEWVGAWTRRAAVFAAVARLRGAAADVDELAALRQAADALLGALRERWPSFAEQEDVAVRWPALTG
jgi:hypothetical protein